MGETLCPTDFEAAGQLVDTNVFDIICAPLPSGVKLIAIFDCCHSGTGLDLPYKWLGRKDWKQEDNPYHCAADIQLISGCTDSQTSADVRNREGPAGGAMTTALCDCLEQNPVPFYPDLLKDMHERLL